MIVAILALVVVAQSPVIGPPLVPGKHHHAVQRTDDGAVLGAIGARDANIIEVATLATRKASGGARSLATTELKDHRLSLTAGARLAKELHVPRLLPADSVMARAQVDEMAALNALSGDAFNRAFVQFIVTDHKAAILKVTGTEIAQAKGNKVKEFVRKRLPKLRAHQTQAEEWLAAHPE